MAITESELKDHKDKKELEEIWRQISVTLGPEELKIKLEFFSNRIGSQCLAEIINSGQCIVSLLNDIENRYADRRRDVNRGGMRLPVLDMDYTIPESIIDKAYKMVRLFILHGANVNQRDHILGSTPIHHAPAEIAELLIMHGADAGAKNKLDHPPLAINFDWTWDIQRTKILLRHSKSGDIQESLLAYHFNLCLTKLFNTREKARKELIEIMDLCLSKIPGDNKIKFFTEIMEQICVNRMTGEKGSIEYDNSETYEAFVSMLGKHAINKASCPEIFNQFKSKVLEVYLGWAYSGIKKGMRKVFGFSCGSPASFSDSPSSPGS